MSLPTSLPGRILTLTKKWDRWSRIALREQLQLPNSRPLIFQLVPLFTHSAGEV
jgi:hypothetical protein